MPLYDVANVVTVTKMNLILEIPCGYGTLRTSAVRIRHKVSHKAVQRSQLLSKSPTDLSRGLSCTTMSLSYKSNLIILNAPP